MTGLGPVFRSIIEKTLAQLNLVWCFCAGVGCKDRSRPYNVDPPEFQLRGNPRATEQCNRDGIRADIRLD